MSIDFEKWFSTINADFPMHFLERLDGEYCNPAARAMYDMYLRIKELEAERDKLRGAGQQILDGKQRHSLSRRTVTNTSLLKMKAALEKGQ